jgi:hypothetical protein
MNLKILCLFWIRKKCRHSVKYVPAYFQPSVYHIDGYVIINFAKKILHYLKNDGIRNGTVF